MLEAVGVLDDGFMLANRGLNSKNEMSMLALHGGIGISEPALPPALQNFKNGKRELLQSVQKKSKHKSAGEKVRFCTQWYWEGHTDIFVLRKLAKRQTPELP